MYTCGEFFKNTLFTVYCLFEKNTTDMMVVRLVAEHTTIN